MPMGFEPRFAFVTICNTSLVLRLLEIVILHQCP